MKYTIATFTFLFLYILQLQAIPGGIEPVKIEPITKIIYAPSFYAEQAELWKKETELNSENPDAWFNFYKAARYANMRADSLAKKYDLDNIIGSIPATLANTFEFNYLLYVQSNWNERKYDRLLKAHEIAPERLDAYMSLINYHVSEGNKKEVAYFGQKLFEAGEFMPSLMAWNYNMLASVDQNGILLTHGDNDTYPAWVLQGVKKTRPDVSVLNINFLMQRPYRERVFEELGLPQINAEDYPNYQDFYLAITRQFVQQKDRPVFVATSVPQFLRNALGDSLYMVGLAFKYATQPFDNVAFLKNNFENKFLKDHLRIQLEPDTGSNVMANMNMHYLPALITLRQHHIDSGDKAIAGELEPMIRTIAQKAGKEQFIAQYLNLPSRIEEDFVSTISVRSLQKGIVNVRKNLYAGTTEVTNADYEAFLMDLVKNKEFEILEICKSPKTNWRQLLPEKYQHLTDSQVFSNGHPDDGDAPVQNISYEAAVEYCKWITKVYNRSDDKKKSFSQVTFRLPSEEEWEFAAHANRTAPYPWGGFYYRNAKGCFLFNTEVAEEKPCEDCPGKGKITANDGSFFPVTADAYFPNDLGLYNTSGNVAEMVDMKGIAKGGSWEDKPDQSQIMSQKKYDTPSPAIGFRVFMVVN